jgi:hypothetical protein
LRQELRGASEEGGTDSDVAGPCAAEDHDADQEDGREER